MDKMLMLNNMGFYMMTLLALYVTMSLWSAPGGRELIAFYMGTAGFLLTIFLLQNLEQVFGTCLVGSDYNNILPCTYDEKLYGAILMKLTSMYNQLPGLSMYYLSLPLVGTGLSVYLIMIVSTWIIWYCFGLIVCLYSLSSMTSHTFLYKNNFIFNLDSLYYEHANTNLNLLVLSPMQSLFISLTLFLSPMVVLSSLSSLSSLRDTVLFIKTTIMISILLILCFSTFNLFVFIIFFEATTVPLLVYINFFGHSAKKISASWYLLIYTLIGSIFLFTAVILIYSEYGTTNLLLMGNSLFLLSDASNDLMWICLFLGFSIKIPMMPFHMWLPEAHVEAPTGGSIMLAGVLLKLGTYGLLVFLLPFFESAKFLPLVYMLTTMSILYSSYSLFSETHLKKIMAYSSIMHMNMGVMGLFSLTKMGILGSIFMFISHGFMSAGLFYSAGIMFDKFKTYDISVIKNLSLTMPKFSGFLLILMGGNIGLPLTSGFMGEFLILLGEIKWNFNLTLILLIGLFLNTLYNMSLLMSILYGNSFSMFFNNRVSLSLHYKRTNMTTDMSSLDVVVLSWLSLIMIILGIYPQMCFSFITNDFVFLGY